MSVLICVIRPACPTSWLIAPVCSAGNESDSVRQKKWLQWETAAYRLSPWQPPLPAWRPLTDARPALPSLPLSFLPLVFSQLACRPKHTLGPPTPSMPRDAQKRSTQKHTADREERRAESGLTGGCCLCFSGRRSSCGSINDFFVWFVAECPLLQPSGNSLRPAAVVSQRFFLSRALQL